MGLTHGAIKQPTRRVVVQFSLLPSRAHTNFCDCPPKISISRYGNTARGFCRRTREARRPDIDLKQFAAIEHMTLSEKTTLSSEEVSNLLASGSVSPQEDIDRLGASALLLENQIKTLVLDNRELLLAETASVRDAAKDFQKLFLSVRSLQSVASRVKAEVSERQVRLSSKIRELANMYETVDLLRQTTYHIKLVQKIKEEYTVSTADEHHDGKTDLSKVARLAMEASQAWKEADLSGIRICEENHKFVEATIVDIRRRAIELLERGVESRNQVDIGSALQALHGLRELGPSLDSLIQEMVQRVKNRFMRSLDAKRVAGAVGLGGLGGIGSGGAVQSQENESKVWSELEKSMDELRESAICASYLEKVLRKRKDLSNTKLVDLLNDDTAHPFATFWEMATGRVKDCFEAVMVSRSRIVRDTLAGHYQRLAGLLEGILASITRETMDGRSRTISDNQYNMYYAMVSSVESEYLTTTQARLESLALTAFPGGARPLPSQVDLQALNARLFEEMKSAHRAGGRVAALAMSVVGTVLLTVASQARDMGDVVNTITNSAAQERNLDLVKCVEDLAKNAVIMQAKLVTSTSSKAARALDVPLDALRQTALELLEPVYKSHTDHMKNIIKKIHTGNFAAAECAESEVATPSSYIMELNNALSLFGRDVLRVSSTTTRSASSRDANKDSVTTSLTSSMCSSLMLCWIKHASFVRPLTTPGKLQLAKDAAELERGLRLLTTRFDISQLHTFKKLAFMDSISDVKAMAMRKQLPRSVILHHLFSRLPESISSPHTRSKLSPIQYYIWVEDHSEEEVLKLINTTLAGTTDVPTLAGDPVVGLMNSLLAM
jgi:hypothetical protein